MHFKEGKIIFNGENTLRLYNGSLLISLTWKHTYLLYRDYNYTKNNDFSVVREDWGASSTDHRWNPAGLRGSFLWCWWELGQSSTHFLQRSVRGLQRFFLSDILIVSMTKLWNTKLYINQWLQTRPLVGVKMCQGGTKNYWKSWVYLKWNKTCPHQCVPVSGKKKWGKGK